MATDNRNQSGSQGGGQSGSNNNQGQSGQGQNQGGGQSSGSQQGKGDFNSNDANVEGWEPGQVGEVQDESHDGRLKENRMEGKTLGTTEHAAEAPHSIEKDEGKSSGGSYGSSGNDQSGSGNQGSSGSGNQGGNNNR